MEKEVLFLMRSLLGFQIVIALDMHIDVEEGNAAGLKQGDWGELIKE